MEWLALLLVLALAAVAALALVLLWRAQRRGAQLGAELAQARAQLAERDARLHQAAQQRLELFARLSHDLRTPLASLQGYLELLLLRHGSLEPAEERSYLQIATRHSERLGRLVADLFDLARLDGGEVRPQAEDFVPAELAQDVLQKFAPEAKRRGVALAARCEHGGAALRAHADLGLVARVLEGLVDNALRHTGAGGHVTIRVADAGGATSIAVEDDGSGIAAADLADLFDRFQSGARVRGDRQDGRPGLGLAIAQRIVRLHGGELAVRSAPGRGTTLSFALPPAADRANERRKDAA